MPKLPKTKPVQLVNKKAKFNYELLDKYIAGIVLQGTEVKSIKQGKVSLQESYCYFAHQELWIKMHISAYDHGNIHNHQEKRARKLLLKKRELKKIFKLKQEKNLTLIPVQVFINEKGIAKVQIALAKGKKWYNKLQALKEKDLERALAQSQAD